MFEFNYGYDYSPPAPISVRLHRRMTAGEIESLLDVLGDGAPQITATSIDASDGHRHASDTLMWLRDRGISHTVTLTASWDAPPPAPTAAGSYPATPVDCLLSSLSKSVLWQDAGKRAVIGDLVALARTSLPAAASRYPAAPVDSLLTAVSHAANAWPDVPERDHALGAVAEARVAIGA